MSYDDWTADELSRRAVIIKKLLSQNFTTEQIVNYFDFSNMIKYEPNYCLLYKTNTKCHNIENLNCFFCGCPYFIYDDTGLSATKDGVVYSDCRISSCKGKEFHVDNAIHQDCSDCTIPHKPSFAYRNAEQYIKEYNE